MRTSNGSADESRRSLLRWLVASPLLASLPRAFAEELASELITDPTQALNVMDFEPVAHSRLPPAHFAYLATGVDDEVTLRANRVGFTRFGIRARRLVDIRRVDTSISVLGERWPSPIFLCPTGSERAFHPDGELAVARAARSRPHAMILSTDASTAVEDVNAAYGRPVWYQLYPTDDWNVTRGLIKRVAHAACPALVLTVDLQGESNRETAERGKRRDTRDCSACHIGGFSSAALASRHPMFAGLDVSAITSYSATYATWDFIDRLRRETTMKLLVKGIVTREDAELAVQHGVDGVIVSNHGGRADDTGRSTIECLPEVIEGVRGRVPVLIDSGFRRGTDVFKALALGATAVGIGRPYLWGLAAFGQPGVEAVLDILDRELAMTMRQAGTVDRSAITRAYVTPTA